MIKILVIEFCKDPSPGNGTVNPAPHGLYLVGSSVNFTCNYGFNLSGSLFSICQENYTWDPEPPICYSGNEMKNIKAVQKFC